MNKLDNSNGPLFSIITCTYNSAKYLRENIASVASQTFKDYEHVFVDAFSSDETLEMLQEYQRRSPNNVRIYQLPAKGISNAMNEGIDLAKGRVILHLHSDDRLDSDFVLSWVAKVFSDKNPSLVMGNCRLLGLESERLTWSGGFFKRLLTRVFFKPLMFYTNLVPHPSAYVSKAVFERNGKFLEKYRVVMDYEFWLRVLRNENWLITDQVLSSYRFHPDTISTKQKELGLKEIEEVRAVYRRYYKFSYGIFFIFLKPGLNLKRILRKYK